MRRSLLATAAVLGITVGCTPALPPNHDQGSGIVIGSDLPLTGPDTASVTPLRDAIALAITDRGYVHGYPLRYKALDDSLAGRFNPLRGEQNAKILANDPRVLGMVGPYNSQIAGIEIPVTNKAGLVMISPSNTLDCLTAPSPCTWFPSETNNYFRLAATDSSQARAAAQFAIQKLQVKRFAVLNDGSDFGPLLTDAFIAELTADGGTVALTATYTPTQDDYRPLLRQASAAGAQAIFVGGYFNPPCRIRAQMAGIFPSTAYLIAGDQITDPACISDAGTSADDHLLAMVSSSQPAPSNRVFTEFRTHGIQPVTYTFEAYDAAAILIDAIDRAIKANGGQVPTRREVLNAVAATHGFVGTSGTFTFLPSGDPTQPSVSVYRIENGTWTFWQNVA